MKVRRPLNVKGAAPKSPEEAMALHATLACEPPNSNLHYFVGRCVVQARRHCPRAEPGVDRSQ